MKKYPHGITLAAVCSAIDAYKAHEDDVPEIGILKAFEVLLADSDLGNKLQALAAENAVMLKLLTVISEQYQEVQTESEENAAVIDLDYISDVNTYVSRDVGGENPFAATDAYLNSVRAEGVEMSVRLLRERSESFPERNGLLYAALIAESFAAQLRAGKDGE